MVRKLVISIKLRLSKFPIQLAVIVGVRKQLKELIIKPIRKFKVLQTLLNNKDRIEMLFKKMETHSLERAFSLLIVKNLNVVILEQAQQSQKTLLPNWNKDLSTSRSQCKPLNNKIQINKDSQKLTNLLLEPLQLLLQLLIIKLGLRNSNLN